MTDMIADLADKVEALAHRYALTFGSGPYASDLRRVLRGEYDPRNDDCRCSSSEHHPPVAAETEQPEQRARRTPDLDEAAIRADERQRMASAIDWELSCLGCADRMDALIAERNAGYLEVLREMELVLSPRPYDPGNKRVLAIVRDRIADRPRSSVEAAEGVLGGSGQGAPL